jgi:isoleucyl-tRNA synthetase
MRVAQKLVSLGRAARESAEIGVRQPLAVAQFVTREKWEAGALEKLGDLIKGELNVKDVQTLQGAEDVVTYALNPLPRLLGKKFGQDFPRVQKALREGDPAQVREWALALKQGETITVTLDGTTYEAAPEEVEVQQRAAEGFAIAEEAGYLAALDTRLSDELLREGLAREVVRRIQSTRKDANFEIEDAIAVVYTASNTLAEAITQYADYIQAETLAVSLERGEPGNGNGFYRAEFLPNEDVRKDTSVKGESLLIGIKQVAR